MGPDLIGASAHPTARELESAKVNVRVTIAALWTSMLFVFVYVDLFSTYRTDVRADLDAGMVNGFTVGQTFLLATTAFIVIPSLMVFLTLVLPSRVDRVANLALSSVYALIIVGGAIGEWSYYLLGSAVEVIQLAAVGFYAWTWPRERSTDPSSPAASATSSAAGSGELVTR